MGSTFVSLTNQVLTRMNEITLDLNGEGFVAARGPQALAKQAVNNAIREIFQVTQEWPFLKTTNTETLVPLQTTYSFPADYSSTDYDSFYLKATEGATPNHLKTITWEDYVQNYRSSDDQNTTGSVPKRIVQNYSKSFSVSPPPNKAYEVEYTYWSYPDNLTLYDDTCIIPSRFDYVIVDGAVVYMMIFRSNDQNTAFHQQKFMKGMMDMRRVLVDEPLYIRSTVINAR